MVRWCADVRFKVNECISYMLLLGSRTWSTRIAVACIEQRARPSVAGVTDRAFATLGAFYRIVAVDIPVAYKDIKKWDIIVVASGVQNQSNISSGSDGGIALILMRILSRCHSIQCMHWNRFRIAGRWFLAVYFMHMLTQRWIMARNANRAIRLFLTAASSVFFFFDESERDFYSVRQLKVCPNHYSLSLSHILWPVLFLLNRCDTPMKWRCEKRELN